MTYRVCFGRIIIRYMEATETKSQVKRLNRAFGPVISGVIIDCLDLATFGPIGLYIGLPVGGIAGYWMGRTLGLSRKASLWCALAAGIYYTIPMTGFLPLATIAGAYARYLDSANKDKHDESEITSGEELHTYE